MVMVEMSIRLYSFSGVYLGRECSFVFKRLIFIKGYYE